MTDPHALDPAAENRRQVLYWRLLARLFDPEEQRSLETTSFAVVDELGLPAAVLDPAISVDSLVQRFPDLAADFDGLLTPGPADAGEDRVIGLAPADDSSADAGTVVPAAPGVSADPAAPANPVSPANPVASVDPAGSADPTSAGPVSSSPAAISPSTSDADSTATSASSSPGRRDEVRRAALVSKLLLNVFATGNGEVTAGQLSRWQDDAGWFERACGLEPGGLRGKGRGAGPGAGNQPGNGFGTAPGQLDKLAPVLANIEGDLVRRMHLREVLADSRLARQLTPSMSLIEQLLRDKDNLDGVALANAKALIRQFVDQVAEVLKTQVAQASTGTIDRSVPPKRVFRNLDLNRTIWKNLPNWNPDDEKLYVDKLFYRQTAKRIEPARLIVVVDQSGSMVDAMVNCTILASIFTGLPKVDVHLVAYDTRALDLTPWVHDPFEVLLRTQLGGGTDGRAALELTRPKIADARNTVVVWISDFYEWQEKEVFTGLEALHRSGVKLIPVGSVSSGGQQSVNPWFRQRFKDQGTPVLSGHVRKLVTELKNFLS